MTAFTDLSSQQLHKAAKLKAKITDLEQELATILGSTRVDATESGVQPRKKRKMSAAGKARIAAAQRKRWAKVKAGKK